MVNTLSAYYKDFSNGKKKRKERIIKMRNINWGVIHTSVSAETEGYTMSFISRSQGRREEAQSSHSWVIFKITFSFLHSCSLNSCLWHVGSIVWSVAGVCNFLSQGHRWLCQCTRKPQLLGPFLPTKPQDPLLTSRALSTTYVFNSPHSY